MDTEKEKVDLKEEEDSGGGRSDGARYVETGTTNTTQASNVSVFLISHDLFLRT